MGTSKDERRTYELFKGGTMKAFPGNRFEGMELRDYFAAQIMQKMKWEPGQDDANAYDCYKIADAMMKAREQK